MLVDFSVKNFCSIKEEITLSLVVNRSTNETNQIAIKLDKEKFDLFSFSVIYGPNASGKSNVIKALYALRDLIKESHSLKLDETIPSYKPFCLSSETMNSPVKFEIECIVNNIRYRYVVEFNETEIFCEILEYYPDGRKAALFKREKGKSMKYGSHFKGDKKTIEKSLLPNTLFLSRGANHSHEQLIPIYRYFRDKFIFHVRTDSRSGMFHQTTTQILGKENAEYKKRVLNLLKAADLNITNIEIKEDKEILEKQVFPNDMLPTEIKNKIIEDLSYRPQFGHPVYSAEREILKTIYFDLDSDESGGTIKLYELAGEVLKSLDEGSILLIDEFDSGLHPLITQYLVQLFQNPQINTKGAQLIVATHDTHIMEIDSIIRDQIWFTEKDKYGRTELFSLSEFDKNKVRQGIPYSKWYLDGRFRALPLVDKSIMISELKK